MPRKQLLYALMLIFFISSCGSSQYKQLKYHRIKDSKNEVLLVINNNASLNEATEKRNTLLEASSNQSLENLKDIKPASIISINPVSSMPETECDTLIMRSGAAMAVNIVSIRKDEVVCTKCGDIDGESYHVDLKIIKTIIKADGTHIDIPDQIEAEPKEYPNADDSQAKVALVMGILAFLPVIGWIFAIIGISVGGTIKRKIQKYPEKYKGYKKAEQGQALALTALILGVIIFIAITVALMLAL